MNILGTSNDWTHFCTLILEDFIFHPFYARACKIQFTFIFCVFYRRSPSVNFMQDAFIFLQEAKQVSVVLLISSVPWVEYKVDRGALGHSLQRQQVMHETMAVQISVNPISVWRLTLLICIYVI